MKKQNEDLMFLIMKEPWKISERLDKEEQEWYNEVTALMKKVNTNVFPTNEQFIKNGKNSLYKRIGNYMGIAEFREKYGL